MQDSSNSIAQSVAMALAAADMGVWEWSTGQGMVYTNARWSTMIGYDDGELELSAFHWYSLVHPDDLKIVQVDTAEQAAQSANGQFEVEFRMRHRAGHWLWIQSRGKVMARDVDGAPSRLAGTHQDITERRRNQDDLKTAYAALQTSEARFRSLAELSSDWFWQQDTEFRFTEFTGKPSSTDMPNSAKLGKFRWDLSLPSFTPLGWDAHKADLRAHRPFSDLEVMRTDQAGQQFWVNVTGMPFFDEQGQFQGYRGVGRDITQQKETEETIKRLAFYDPLTQLPNRQFFMERLADTALVCQREKNRAALLFIDMDGFKALNDTKGHQTGDLLLQQVGARLTECVRKVDTVARLGGDEFVVILKSLANLETQAAQQAKQIGLKILSRLNDPFDLFGFEHLCTSSIGLTMISSRDANIEETLQRADLAMYQAKADGRNQLRFFDPAMQAAVERRSALEAALHLALQRDEMCLHYQTIVNPMRRVIGVEALVRWNHPERGMVRPIDFISLAEDCGLIVPLGKWVLRLACQQLASWAAGDHTRHLTMSVNVSARQFRERDFVSLVAGMLRLTGANPKLLKLELTESLLLNDVPDVAAKMQELKDLGVGFALDDFGTGYSSLNYLKSLPLEQLKIDKGFVRDVLSDASDAAIAITILTLAQALNLSVVAEGVETEGQLQFLKSNGCRAFQGYLFSQPVAVEALNLDAV